MKSVIKNQRGFGLVEGMIALSVLSVALLGLARLQAAGMQANTNAYLQSQAAMIAQDMFERIRSNPDADYSIALASGIPAGPSQCEGSGVDCTNDQLASYDLANWKCALGALSADTICTTRNIEGVLPSGQGSIAVTTDNEYTMIIQWFDPADGVNQQFRFEATI